MPWLTPTGPLCMIFIRVHIHVGTPQPISGWADHSDSIAPIYPGIEMSPAAFRIPTVLIAVIMPLVARL